MQELPLVAIVGRPNVGKSTLFNRYAGHRRALVADIAGVTRDRVAEEIEIQGRRILLVDTAGLDREAASGHEIDRAVQAQARSAVDDADAILFLVDGAAGLLPEDEAIAKTLRRTDKPIALAVNKIDVPQHADRVTEFYGLGFERTSGLSAEHGSGAFEALEVLVDALPPEVPGDDEDDSDDIRIALVGRPNVGKSSLVNRMAGEARVVVSNVPGTTRDAIDIRLGEPGEENGDLVLVDTAGLRRPGRRERLTERASALMTVRALERATVALLVIDASEGFGDQDAKAAVLALERGCALAVLANKWDLVESEERDAIRDGIKRGLRFASHAPVLEVSAQSGARVGRIPALVRQVAESARCTVPTAELNRWLRESVARHEPSMARKGRSRRPIKFFYATQSGVSPPTFVLFCTEPEAVLPSYRRFLENRLRERFGFEGTPVRLRLRARSRRKGRGGAAPEADELEFGSEADDESPLSDDGAWAEEWETESEAEEEGNSTP